MAADYRLAPQTRFPGILEDCKSAVDFVRSSPLFESATNNRVDSSKLIVSGSSAGGWLSLLAGTGIGYSACGLERPVGISGVAAIYPITDLLDPFWTTKQHPVSYKGYMIGRKEVEPFIDPQDTKTASSPIGGKRDTFYSYMIQECVLFLFSPGHLCPPLITLSDRVRRAILGSLLLDGTNIPESEFSVAANLKYMATIPTMYIIHGNGDDKVPHRQSTDVVNVLKVVGAQVEYHEPDGLDHSFDDDPNCDMGSMYEFISRVF